MPYFYCTKSSIRLCSMPSKRLGIEENCEMESGNFISMRKVHGKHIPNKFPSVQSTSIAARYL